MHIPPQAITDPLYLQHPPQYYQLLEDEEAARYAPLFRHRLIEHSPDWQAHATRLVPAPPGARRTLVMATVPAQLPVGIVAGTGAEMGANSMCS